MLGCAWMIRWAPGLSIATARRFSSVTQCGCWKGPRNGSVAEIVGVDNERGALQVLLEADGHGGLDIALVLSPITRRVRLSAR